MHDWLPYGSTGAPVPGWHGTALAGLAFPLGWKDGAGDPSAWRRTARAAYRSALIEDASPVDPGLEVLSVERREGYELRSIRLALGRLGRAHAYLAVPFGRGPFPAALLLHDHGGFFAIGKEKMIRPPAGHRKTGISADWMERNYAGRSVGDDLALAGWAVLVADAPGWGDRDCGGYGNQQAVASNLFNLGSSWAGLIAAEDVAAADFLASLPEVDPARVAAIGHSMGGFRSWQVSALSDRVTASVATCCFGTIAALMRPGENRTRGQSAFSMTHPGLSRLMDFPDMAAIGAPKPLLMIHGTEDRLFPIAGVEEACLRTVAVYRAFAHPEKFRSVLRPGGHVFGAGDQALALAWLDDAWRDAIVP